MGKVKNDIIKNRNVQDDKNEFVIFYRKCFCSKNHPEKDYYSNYLKEIKNIDLKKIDFYVRPELGLKAAISCLLKNYNALDGSIGINSDILYYLLLNKITKDTRSDYRFYQKIEKILCHWNDGYIVDKIPYDNASNHIILTKYYKDKAAIFSSESIRNKTIQNGESFIIVPTYAVNIIFQSEGINGGKLFAYYLNLLSTINFKKKYGDMSQDDMSEAFHIAKSTIHVYNQKLEDLKLIFIKRSNYMYKDDFHRLSNIYGRYEDKEYISTVSSESTKKKWNRLYIENKKIDRRGIKNRYKYFISGSKKYKNPVLLQKLYNDCSSYNSSLKDSKLALDLSPITKMMKATNINYTN